MLFTFFSYNTVTKRSNITLRFQIVRSSKNKVSVFRPNLTHKITINFTVKNLQKSLKLKASKSLINHYLL